MSGAQLVYSPTLVIATGRLYRLNILDEVWHHGCHDAVHVQPFICHAYQQRCFLIFMICLKPKTFEILMGYIVKLERNAGNTKGRKECCGLFNMKAAGFFGSQATQRRLTKRGALGL